MKCMPSGPAVLKDLKLFIAQLSFSGVEISSVIESCITRGFQEVSAKIFVSAGTEPGKWLS